MFRSPDGRIISWGTTFELDLSGNIASDWIRMTRTYSLIIEGDTRGYSVYVPELPMIPPE